MYEKLKPELRIRYLDDISMVGPTQTVAADVILLVKAASKLELKLNATKYVRSMPMTTVSPEPKRSSTAS